MIYIFLMFGNTVKPVSPFTVLPNLRKQISLICLLSVLKMSQCKHELYFILVTLYFRINISDRLERTSLHLVQSILHLDTILL
jgi:hypothetical protein